MSAAATGGAVSEKEVRRLLLALGLATARQDEQSLLELLADLDSDTAGALVVGLLTSWVGSVEMSLRLQGAASPLADTITLLKAEALEVAGE
ncbi:hypothetical protein ACMZ5F_11395 [Streptomyces rhizosphaericola]|uniref:hypothetical protein n=1 Tax=Streptomyces rhizosphaericola TaxID=2564098 RepID=UPI0039EFE164